MKITIEQYFRGFGFIFIVIIVFRMVTTYLFIEKSVFTDGIVISHELEWVKESNRMKAKWKTIYCPVVKFYDQNNLEVKFKSEICDERGVFEIEEKVGVYYNPKKLTQAKIKSFKYLWADDIVISLIISFLCFGVAPLFRLYKNVSSK
ncbi:MAG: DUF3592 domain-containing protein [Gammaproteobacteria bacterium]|nr:MAG: DUF3592 domain-containing protein [Gammaproteobacteria bacterium]